MNIREKNQAMVQNSGVTVMGDTSPKQQTTNKKAREVNPRCAWASVGAKRDAGNYTELCPL